MIEHYTMIDESLRKHLEYDTRKSNTFDNCHQPFMLDNDEELFPNVPKFYLLKKNTHICSMCSIYFIDEQTVYLYGFTKPTERRKGYMKQLMDDVLQTLRPLAISHYIVPISKDNLSGLHFVTHQNATLLETECHMVCNLDILNTTESFDSVKLCCSKDNEFSVYTLVSADTSQQLGQLFCLIENFSAAIFDVEIWEEFQGIGYGSQFLSLVMKELKNNGLKTITLHVTRENTPAYHLYRKHGFVETETILYFELL